MIDYIMSQPPTLIIAASAICGAVYGYLHRWAWSDSEVSLASYLFGDMKMFFRVVFILAGSIAANVIVDIPGDLANNMTALITLGFGIGIAVPQKVDKKMTDSKPI